MKVPFSWLKDFVNYDGDPTTLGHKLTISGTKLESIDVVGEGLDKLYVGEVVSCEDHPKADKLKICEVNLGDLDLSQFDVPEGDTVTIVCGAPNVAAGQKVIVAMPGAKLPEFTIGARKLRGVMSYGMICAMDELGFDPSVLREGACDGIEVLPEHAEVGTSVAPYIGLGETVLDFELTSNRPDCLSMEGIGRETAVTFDLDFSPRKPEVRGGGTWDGEPMKVSIDAPEACRVYLGRYVKDVVIEPSPLWMQRRLRDAGIRPINNFVDITNYVLLDIGQPLHAFDANFLQGNEIHVRYASDGEDFKTLDGQTRKLSDQDLVIADRDKPVALAGVMGGENSEIRKDTKNVFFEAANFAPVGVGRTSRRLDLRSESSSRFDKGLDPKLPRRALDLACALVEQLGAGTVCDAIYEDHGTQPETPEIPLEPERINHLLGTDIEADWMIDILEKLGCQVEDGIVKPPSWRVDLSINADLAEEVARFYDYNEITPTLPELPGELESGLNLRQRRVDRLRDLCASYACYETMTYPFQRVDKYKELGIELHDDPRVKIRDTGREYARLRDCLLPSLLDVGSLNQRRGNDPARFYEIARAYHAELGADGLPKEEDRLTVMFQDEDNSGQSFYEIKGLLLELSRLWGLDDLWSYKAIKPEDHPTFHPYRTAEVLYDGEKLGILGYIHPNILDEKDITAPTCYLEITLEALLDKPGRWAQAEPVSRYPSMERDLALVVKRSLEVGPMLEALKKAAGPLLEEASLFDVYEGEPLAEDEKSVALRFVFTNLERTLQEEEVNDAMASVLEEAEQKFAASIRS